MVPTVAGDSWLKAHYLSATSPGKYVSVDSRKKKHHLLYIFLSGFEADTVVLLKIQVVWDVNAVPTERHCLPKRR
jgi:hypothetical protein